MPPCAIGAALLTCALIGACLNPLPEEFPSNRDSAPVTVDGPRQNAGGGASGIATPPPGSDDGAEPNPSAEGSSPSERDPSVDSSPSTPDSGGAASAPDAGAADAGTVEGTDEGNETSTGEATAP